MARADWAFYTVRAVHHTVTYVYYIIIFQYETDRGDYNNIINNNIVIRVQLLSFIRAHNIRYIIKILLLITIYIYSTYIYIIYSKNLRE